MVGQPKEIKAVDNDHFNTLYCLNDQLNFRIFHWVDNNIMTMVSTIYNGKDTILPHRQKPRTTTTNWNHVNVVWGSNPMRAIEIPKVINNYNHWMLGVDKSNQFIAYHCPTVCARRYWMAMMFHGLDILRVNLYIVYKFLIR